MMNALPPNRRFPQVSKLPASTRRQLVAGIVDALNGNPAAVERAIAILFARQTATEKAREATVEDNALGVRHNHGKRIAYYGKWIASGKKLTGHHLDFARRIAMTYSKTQLLEVAALKAGLIQP